MEHIAANAFSHGDIFATLGRRAWAELPETRPSKSKRHGEPFAKRGEGRARRAERKAKEARRYDWFNE